MPPSIGMIRSDSNAGHDGSAAKCPTDTGHFELIDSLIADTLNLYA